MQGGLRKEWRHAIHERFGESLNYYFLGFSPTYQRGRVLEALHDLLRREKIRGYTFYEVFGPTDVVLKIWLPATRVAEFFELLKVTFFNSRLNLATIERFQAEYNPYDSVWGTGPTNTDPADLIRNTSIRDIIAVQEGENENKVSQFERAGLFQKVNSEPGIKFFITIPPPGRGVSLRVFDGLVQNITTSLQQARAADTVAEVKIYQGNGPLVAVLIEGLVPFTKYELIPKINEEVNRHGIDNFDAKTTTFLGVSTSAAIEASDGKIYFLEITEKPDLLGVTEYLNSQESEELEHKGTLEFDINKYLATGTRERNPEMVNEVLKTVVAFLNTTGGDVVVGAFDEARISPKLRDNLKDLPSIGSMRICGVDWEYGARGWDGFIGKLTDLIEHRIDPGYAHNIKIRRLEYGGKDLCVIRVIPLPKGDWAYLDDGNFYVRHGASTRLLRGAQQERYQRLKFSS